MNSTIQLLKVIGSPFEDETTVIGPWETRALFDCATKNKVSVFYLESLNRKGQLDRFKQKYADACAKYEKYCQTLARACNLLNETSADYAVIKSILSYPAVPNDVDVLLFGNSYQKVVQTFLKNGYETVGGVLYEAWLHDSRDGPHMTGKKKCVYDIDLYGDIGASYLVYLQKQRMKKYKQGIKFMDFNVTVLAPEAELLLMIFHSVFPEKIFTLSHYYAILYHLYDMSRRQVETFLEEVQKNNMVIATREIVKVSASLHYTAFGFVPEVLERISSRLRIHSYSEDAFVMPHKHSSFTLLTVLSEKLKEKPFRKCVARQMQSMLDLRNAAYVLFNSLERSRRETY